MEEVYHPGFGFMKVVYVEKRPFGRDRLHVHLLTGGIWVFKGDDLDKVCDAKIVRNYAEVEIDRQRRADEREAKKAIEQLVHMLELRDTEIAGLKREVESLKEFMIGRNHEGKSD